MLKYRKGELIFYKGMTPKELNKYVNDYPINTEYVKQFLDDYKYNYVKDVWIKGQSQLYQRR